MCVCVCVCVCVRLIKLNKIWDNLLLELVSRNKHIQKKYQNIPIASFIFIQVTSEPTATNQVSSFYLNMTSGSMYECTWRWDDGSTDSVSNDATTPISGALAFTHTYTTPGIYSVNIECVNYVSSDTTSVTHVVQDPITGK